MRADCAAPQESSCATEDPATFSYQAQRSMRLTATKKEVRKLRVQADISSARARAALGPAFRRT